MAVLTVLILLHFLSPNLERSHWIKSIGIRVNFVEFDVDDGVSLLVPQALYNYVIPCFRSTTPLRYILLWSVKDLMD